MSSSLLQTDKKETAANSCVVITHKTAHGLRIYNAHFICSMYVTFKVMALMKF